MNKYNIEELINEGCNIIDVRSRAEFMGGHVNGSINIPLDEIPQELDQLRLMTTPFIVCCASGNRSSQAQRYLSQLGIECVNGGSWMDINLIRNKYA